MFYFDIFMHFRLYLSTDPLIIKVRVKFFIYYHRRRSIPQFRDALNFLVFTSFLN